MFLPNRRGVLKRATLTYNRDGEATSGTPETVQCAVVKLIRASQTTAVRTDASATRGSSEEIIADSVILFPKSVEPSVGDEFEVSGVSLIVFKVHQRFDILGDLDHFECDLRIAR